MELLLTFMTTNNTYEFNDEVTMELFLTFMTTNNTYEFNDEVT